MQSFVRVIIKNELSEYLVLCSKAHNGLWNFPGGKVEINESPKQAAIREVFEETGLIIKTLYPIKKKIIRIKNKNWEGHFFYATCVNNLSPINVERHKCNSMKFASKRNLMVMRCLPNLLSEVIQESNLHLLPPTIAKE